MTDKTSSSLELSPEEKRALLVKLLEKKASEPKSYPLSLGQERIFVLEQFNPNTAIHNIPIAYYLDGELNISLLEKSLQKIVDRHESLRTSIVLEDDKPVQKISPQITIKLSIQDLSNLPIDEQNKKVETIKNDLATQPFDVMKLPLWRFQLLKLNTKKFILILTFHHIIFDRVSIGIFMQELAAVYTGSLTNNLSVLLEKKAKQYANFSQSQKQWLDENREFLVNYWQNQLGGAMTSLKLPTLDSQYYGITYKGERKTAFIESSLTEKIKQLSHQLGVSLYTMLLASFKVLLHQYTHQEDIIICSPVAGRYRSQSRGVIGYFNNIVPIRSQLKTDLTFEQLLKQIAQVSKEAYEHQELPFQDILTLPNISSISLTKGMFALQNIDGLSIQLPNLQNRYEDLPNKSINFDLFLFIEEKEEGLLATLDYKTQIFSEVTIIQVLKQYQNTLTFLVHNPRIPINKLPDLSSHILDLEKESTFISKPSISKFIEPRNPIESKLKEIWQDLLGKKTLSITDSFFELGGNSIIAAQLFLRIEKEFNKKLPLTTLLKFSTIESLASTIKGEEISEFWGSLIAIQPQGFKPPFFCCPGVYGNVIYYRPLALLLGTDQPFYGLQSKGLDGKDIPLETLEDMAAVHIQEIKTIQPQGPYYLGGHSFGAKLAFEIAQQLRSQGEKVALLALFDPEPPKVDRRLLTLTIKNLETISKLSFPKALDYINKKIQSYVRIISQSYNPPLNSNQSIEYIVKNKLYAPKVFENNMQAGRNYIPKTYPGKITIFRASELSTLEESHLQQWKELALEGFEVHQIPGDHHSLLQEPNIKTLAEKIKMCL
ncbi:MAG: condensation domain-containing protein [Crocosphaera sp.]